MDFISMELWSSLSSNSGRMANGNLLLNTEKISESEDDSDGEPLMGLPEPYIEICTLGKGSYGWVMMAEDRITGRLVAVKKMSHPFGSPQQTKICYRELHLLGDLQHPNIVTLVNAFVDEDNENLYIVTDYVQNDLRSILKTGELASLDAIRRTMHQVLQALTYLHHRNVIHRDLKPENLLITDHGDVKICDLGLARRANHEMTGYLATRYYRAPEFMLTWRHYGPAVDMWSAGCIFAELATGKVLFPAQDHVTHVRLITELVGSPPASLMERVCSPTTMRYLQLLPPRSRADFSVLFGTRLGKEGTDLLNRMLEFDPQHRISPQQALHHPFFQDLTIHPRHHELMTSPPLTCLDLANPTSGEMEEILETNELDWAGMLRHELHKYSASTPDWDSLQDAL